MTPSTPPEPSEPPAVAGDYRVIMTLRDPLSFSLHSLRSLRPLRPLRPLRSLGLLGALVPGLLFGGAACDRGDTADGLAFDPCVDEVTVLSGVDAATALGFTAAEVLAVAEGDHQAPIFWHPGAIQFGPETGEGELQVAITYAGGEVRYIHSTSTYGDDGSCVSRLEVDAEVALQTAGGALDESFTATLRASRPDAATFRHELPLDAVAGDLAVTAVEPANGEATPLSLEVGVSTFGIFGSFDGGIEVHSGDAVGFGFHNYATFPTDGLACDFPAEAPVPFDASWAGVAVSEALALLEAHPDLTLQWEGDPATALTIAASPTGPTACGRLDDNGANQPLRFDIALTMSSADGRLDGTLPLRTLVEVDAEGALSGLVISREAPYGDYAAVADFAAVFGVHGVDLGGYDGGGITFDLTCDAEGHHGAITVLGATVHPCSDEPGAGCRGTDMTEVVSGTWSSGQ